MRVPDLALGDHPAPTNARNAVAHGPVSDAPSRAVDAAAAAIHVENITALIVRLLVVRIDIYHDIDYITNREYI
jgi:hypothetical protein